MKEDNRDPALYHVRSGSQIYINKPEFVLGKSVSLADYAVVGNTKVSRTHAKLLCNAERWYIMDLRSTNGTFIDGQKIPPEMSYEISVGQKIKLGDEEFVFQGVASWDSRDDSFDGGTSVL